MEQYLQYAWLIPLGLIAGAYGTVIGAGGGFVLVPLLLLLYPDASPETITSISLTVVFFNALSATLAYAKAKRIDYRSAVMFAIASVPGAVLGALATSSMSRERFDLLFGSILTLIAVFLASNPRPKVTVLDDTRRRRLELRVSTLIGGAFLSTLLGFVSSFFGIGGGFIYVPALIYLLRFPVQIATATSLFILTVTTFTGAVTHVAAGLFQHGVRRAIMLSFGAIIGAQVGAKIAIRIKDDWIVRVLAITLGLVGLRIIALRLWF